MTDLRTDLRTVLETHAPDDALAGKCLERLPELFGAVPKAVRITAADANLALPWNKMFDGSPFSVVPWPTWLRTAIEERRVWPHTRGSTDYAQWDVETPRGTVSAGPGNWIIRDIEGLFVAKEVRFVAAPPLPASPKGEIDPETLALAQEALERIDNDTRTVEEQIRDGVSFLVDCPLGNDPPSDLPATQARADSTGEVCDHANQQVHHPFCPDCKGTGRTPSPSPAASQKDTPAMSVAQIKHMVDRFLAWRLPESFSPDAGISFKAKFNEHTAHPMMHEPMGTNLFNATQAEAMVRHMIEGLPSAAPSPTASPRKHVLYEKADKDCPESICDRNGDVVLGLCRICGRGEIELEEDGGVCPGPRPAASPEAEAVDGDVGAFLSGLVLKPLNLTEEKRRPGTRGPLSPAVPPEAGEVEWSPQERLRLADRLSAAGAPGPSDPPLASLSENHWYRKYWLAVVDTAIAALSQRPQPSDEAVRRRYGGGPPFPCAINGPSVSLGQVWPVVEYGDGSMRVVALATAEDAQETIVRALSQSRARP